jgi:hypothetical protein
MSKFIRKFSEYDKINEADIYNNKGIPTEYLDKVSKENKEKALQTPPANILGLSREIRNIQKGYEEELEKLAIDTIKMQYGNILDNVEIDAKIVKPTEVNSSIEEIEIKEEQEENSEAIEDGEDDEDFDLDALFDDPIDIETISPEILKDEVDKRKISNAFLQGESKNIHRIIHLPEVKDKLDNINKDFVPLMDKLLKSNEMVEWVIGKSFAMNAMENNPNGKSKVSWENISDNKENQESAKNILDDMSSVDDLDNYNDELEDIFDEGKPKIYARAIDFPILLHEITKGIFELIIARSIPNDKDLAQRIIDQTDTYEDEFDDLRFGLDMRKDITLYLNKMIDEVSKTDRTVLEHENLKEFLFGNLVDTEYVPTKDFLLITNVIFSISSGKVVTPEDVQKANNIIKTNIRLINDTLNQEKAEYERYLKDLEEYEKGEKEDIKTVEPGEKKEIKQELSLIDNLKKELQKAIDDEDYESAAEFKRQIDEITD